MNLAAERLHAGQAVWIDPAAKSDLAAHLSRRQARVEAGGGEGRVRLTLAVHDSADVLKEAGKALLGAEPTTHVEGIEAADTGVELVEGFAEGEAVPAQLAFGPTLASGSEEADGARHEVAAVKATEGGGRVAKVLPDGFSEFHGNVSLRADRGHPMG